MTVLVDTGVLYAEYDRSATRHDAAADAMETVYDGELGQPFTSDYIYDEVVTLTQRRTGSFEVAKTLGERLRGVGSFPDVYSLLYVTPAVFGSAVETFEQFDDQGLSFTDAATVALADRHDIDTILAFDDGFDGIADRTDPAML
ncbi:type II toxin-antitoxin system VapC family toxin [Halorientalis litorea]|jgi:predicted nucleic acid-binding protein|uniref:type II toxin-antitoxin system VapC family toxin n=1 Tax=Halorientalis litorea TaxID=2931977 RepID=UPI001FF0F96D|nr:type II toxin-antitoxin system VapC family toxin [Halorientalis litorea]